MPYNDNSMHFGVSGPLKDLLIPEWDEEGLFTARSLKCWVCSFVCPQVCHCVQWHISVPSPPTYCIMDEMEETEAAGVLANKKKRKKKNRAVNCCKQH